MTSELYLYCKYVLSLPNFQAEWQSVHSSYLNKDFQPDLESYLKASTVDRYHRFRVVNFILKNISFFPFLEAEYLGKFCEIFTNTCTAINTQFFSYVYPDNLAGTDFTQPIATIKNKHPILLLTILETFLSLTRIKAPEEILSFDSDILRSLYTFNQEEKFPKKYVAFISRLMLKFINNDEYAPTEKEVKDYGNVFSIYLRQQFLQRRFTILGNPGILFNTVDFSSLEQYSDFKIFLSTLSSFILYNTHIERIVLCDNCSSVFYNVGRFAFSCSVRCNNIRKVNAFNKRKRNRSSIYTSMRSYDMDITF